ncbi:hypothetical protein B0H14DRAFT_1702504 [Mycena olivaceomarginata]|nr:hypothetical protein B0H14DRAFT_1702504 [Mycena olivaceomarginata]
MRSQKQQVPDTYKYPVLALPNEITIDIFTHFMPIYPLCPPLTGLYSPSLLTQICRRWREIALATPALWRAISLSDSSIPFEQQDNVVRMWLSRSRSYPLSLDFDEDSIDRVHAVEAMSALLPHCARWEYLNLRLSVSRLRMIQGPTPLLRHLDLWLVDNDLILTMVEFQVPLLRTAVLNDVTLQNLTLPWAQLTSLTLRRVYPRECVPVLQHTSSLVHCELGLVGDDDHTDIFPDITLPSLQSLTLTGSSRVGHLPTPALPTLHNLRIPESMLAPSCIDTLASFLAKSHCQLQELCVVNRVSVPEDSYRATLPLVKIFFHGQALSARFAINSLSSFRRLMAMLGRICLFMSIETTLLSVSTRRPKHAHV